MSGNILIVSNSQDDDAVIVARSLSHYGVKACIWNTELGPKGAKQSLFIDNCNAKNQWHLHESHQKYLIEDFDTIWIRRPLNYQASCQKEEASVINKENENFLRWLFLQYPKSHFLVNDPSNQTSLSKMFQLRLASQIGLKIPSTLFSNNAEDIRVFVKKTPKVVYKPLQSPFWEDSDYAHMTYTTSINCKDLPNDNSLEMSPGIFQEHISKSYEIRATFFGTQDFSIKISPRNKSIWPVDWRSENECDMQFEAIVLPEVVKKQCISMLKSLNLNMGCFDFIVTPQGDYVFLEVNEAGQFLFVEQYVPTLKVLDAFTQFLITRNFSYCYQEHEKSVTLAQILKTIN